MFEQGEIISYLDMCREEGVNLQRGMNFRLRGGMSVILMNIHPNAPYADRIEKDGRVLIYEGHDVPKGKGISNPKTVDQVDFNRGGSFTQNGLFYEAAMKYKRGDSEPEMVNMDDPDFVQSAQPDLPSPPPAQPECDIDLLYLERYRNTPSSLANPNLWLRYR